jgi:hypothetical protein
MFNSSGEPTKRQDDVKASYECNYDLNPTPLYQAMENEAWVPAMEYFETGKWDNSLLSCFFYADPILPERQARTWVTRYDADGKTVRWSQLPLHAAIIFGAPFKLVEALLNMYPPAIRCTDDQHLLPLHLAIKHGAEDNVVLMLVQHFPEATTTRESRGRTPLQLEGPRQDRTILVEALVGHATTTMKHQYTHEVKDLRHQLKSKESRVSELEVRVQALAMVNKVLEKEKVHLTDTLVAAKEHYGKLRNSSLTSGGPLKKKTASKKQTARGSPSDGPEQTKKVQKAVAETRENASSSKRITTLSSRQRVKANNPRKE